MILKLKMILLVAFYKRNNMIIYEKSLKLSKNYTFNNFFCNRIFSYYYCLPIMKKVIGFSQIMAYFPGKIIIIIIII